MKKWIQPKINIDDLLKMIKNITSIFFKIYAGMLDTPN